MKINALICKLLMAIALIFSLSGCFQYPEGPFFTLQTKDERIDGTWKIVHVTDASGNDVTSEFLNRTLTVVAGRSGEHLWSEFDNGILVSGGTYQFADRTDYIIILYTILNGIETEEQSFYTVRQLTEDKFEYIDDSGFDIELEKY